MHKYSLQLTIELKTPPQINFGKCLERKRCRKSLKIPKTILAIHNLWYEEKDSKKNVSFEFSEIVRSLPGKGLQWSHSIKLTGLLLETKRF